MAYSGPYFVPSGPPAVPPVASLPTLFTVPSHGLGGAVVGCAGVSAVRAKRTTNGVGVRERGVGWWKMGHARKQLSRMTLP